MPKAFKPYLSPVRRGEEPMALALLGLRSLSLLVAVESIKRYLDSTLLLGEREGRMTPPLPSFHATNCPGLLPS